MTGRGESDCDCVDWRESSGPQRPRRECNDRPWLSALHPAPFREPVTHYSGCTARSPPSDRRRSGSIFTSIRLPGIGQGFPRRPALFIEFATGGALERSRLNFETGDRNLLPATETEPVGASFHAIQCHIDMTELVPGSSFGEQGPLLFLVDRGLIGRVGRLLRSDRLNPARRRFTEECRSLAPELDSEVGVKRPGPIRETPCEDRFMKGCVAQVPVVSCHSGHPPFLGSQSTPGEARRCHEAVKSL